jgi:phytoene synthase
VGEDARKGASTCPSTNCSSSTTAADLLNARHSENFENLMRFQARARGV